MYYEVWIDADGKRHIIDEMETKYIENCIESIKKQCWPTLIESGEYDERPKQDYQVLSATILFDQPPTDKYHSGSFSVEYKDLNNKVCSLTGGRFKLIHTNEDPINGCSVYFSSEFSALKRKHGRFDANNTDNSSIYL